MEKPPSHRILEVLALILMKTTWKAIVRGASATKNQIINRCNPFGVLDIFEESLEFHWSLLGIDYWIIHCAYK